MKNTNQVLELLRLLKQKYPERNSFTFADFREITKDWRKPEIRKLTDADQPFWDSNYLGDILKNCTTKPKNPKVARVKINGSYHYFPHPPYTY